MARLAGLWRRLGDWWTARSFAVVLLILAAAIWLGGYVNLYCDEWCALLPDPGPFVNNMFKDFYANIAANLEGADLTRAKLREVNLHKANLHGARLTGADVQRAILIHSDLQGANLKGADLLWARLVHADLRGADLSDANLQLAELSDANLLGADLSKANLKWTSDLTYVQLVTAISLYGATTPNDRRYNGQFNLKSDGDFIFIWPEPSIINPPDPKVMADYYGVSLEEYLAGQEWARENLPRLRRKAGLDPDTGLPVEPTNGTEPQPADAPAQPAPRRNGHKASMVSHRVRR